MNGTVQTLQRLAGETGYLPDTLEKVLRLLDLLDEIAGDPMLSERLVLKGGTALNVFYLDLDRLSVDIDLNYIGALDVTTMQNETAASMPRSSAFSPRRATAFGAVPPSTPAANGCRAMLPLSVATPHLNWM